MTRTPQTCVGAPKPTPHSLGMLQCFGLASLTGVLLGFSFPPSSLGMLACVGLVPLLMVIGGQQRLGRVLLYTYVAMVDLSRHNA